MSKQSAVEDHLAFMLAFWSPPTKTAYAVLLGTFLREVSTIHGTCLLTRIPTSLGPYEIKMGFSVPCCFSCIHLDNLWVVACEILIKARCDCGASFLSC